MYNSNISTKDENQNMARKSRYNRTLDEYEELIYRFESTREFLKNKIQDNICEDYSYFVKTVADKYPFLETMLNIYNQRASMGSTDALSIIYRDIIINIFYDIMHEQRSELLQDTVYYFEKTQNMNSVLEKINNKYSWGETIL